MYYTDIIVYILLYANNTYVLQEYQDVPTLPSHMCYDNILQFIIKVLVGQRSV